MGGCIWVIIVEVIGSFGLSVRVGGVVVTERDVVCCWSGGELMEFLGFGVVIGVDVFILVRGRLVSGGRLERSWGGRVDFKDMKDVVFSL